MAIGRSNVRLEALGIHAWKGQRHTKNKELLRWERTRVGSTNRLAPARCRRRHHLGSLESALGHNAELDYVVLWFPHEGLGREKETADVICSHSAGGVDQNIEDQKLRECTSDF